MNISFNTVEDIITGRTSRLRELYHAAFSESEAESLVRDTKKRNRTIALIVLFIIVIAVFSAATETNGRSVPELDLTRPGAGQAVKSIETDISAEYDGYTARQRSSLRILPREPSPEEAESLLKELELRLPDMILGANSSLGDVKQNLVLPIVDDETGAELAWSSSDTRIISKDGKVNLIGSEAFTVVTLTVHISLASAKDTFHIAVKTGSGIPEGDIDDALKGRVAEAVKEVSSARDGETVILPAVTADGVKLNWSTPERKEGLPAVFGCALIAVFCFSLRYRTALRNIEKARAELERDFPEFIQKLVLLLGAGLVITSAISRISEDYIKTREINGKRRLYEEIAAAQERMHSAGTSLIYEFTELARRSGLRELMRFSSTLADNIDKGSTLADKLRTESELLWESRKKRAEKEGRVAETKLIFPMALQILVVIMITVVPAAFEMG